MTFDDEPEERDGGANLSMGIGRVCKFGCSPRALAAKREPLR
jgi:hypothetical protein